ncbi:ProQ/FINO family protein, partial [Arsenophonus nasoniae]|uniref:ProQ/FINO family protein n=1 Tax=Arsenophonus nasoniae TaxID=638 RepID=UPI00387A41DB
MTERQKLSLNRPRRDFEEMTPKSSPVYQKKVWVNSAPKKQVKKPKPQKPVKAVTQKRVEKPQPVVKVKIPKPPKPPKKRLPLAEAVSQISIFWPALFPEHQLRPMKIGIRQAMWQEVNEKGLPLTKKRLRSCLGSIGHHADYRALIQL